MKQQIGAYIAFSIIILVGLGFGIIALKFWIERIQMIQNGIETTAVVTDLNHSRRKKGHTIAPVVTYTTQTGDTLHYSSNIYSNSNFPEIGQRIKIWYDPTNPQKVELGTGRLRIIRLFAVIFLVFTGLGLHSLLYLIRQKKNHKLLRERGQVVQARVDRIVDKWTFQNSPKQLIATWTDPQTQITHTFKSDLLPYNMDLSEVKKNRNIPIIINPENPNQYWMDFSGPNQPGI